MGLVKLGDFGIAKVLEGSYAAASTVIGTPYYMSPEVCQGQAYGYQSDVWGMLALGLEVRAQRARAVVAHSRALKLSAQHQRAVVARSRAQTRRCEHPCVRVSSHRPALHVCCVPQPLDVYCMRSARCSRWAIATPPPESHACPTTPPVHAFPTTPCPYAQAWNGSNLLGLVYKIVQEKQPPLPDFYSEELRQLVTDMLSKRPEHRPSLAQVRTHLISHDLTMIPPHSHA